MANLFLSFPFCLLCLYLSAHVISVLAQTSAQPSPSPTLSLVLTTSFVNVTSAVGSQGQNIPVTILVPTVFNVTRTLSPSSTAPSSASSSVTPTPTPIVLATRLDPAFGVLGALLIITGLPSAFWGHKNRWYVLLLYQLQPLLMPSIGLPSS
jgi:hypothetical protein